MQERLPVGVKRIGDVLPGKEEAANWIIENQLGRRNLTPGQKLYLIGMKERQELRV